ncbi:MAG: endonuclease III [Candidatus Aenigmatarchaeota archaeon]
MKAKKIRNIGIVIKILKRETKKFEIPIVTESGKKTKNPFKVLISCLLSIRTRDEITTKASKKLFSLADTPEKMIKLSTRQIEKAIYPVGFYKTKSRRIKEICKKLINEYNSKVPDTLEELLKLKGVGRKTANIVLVYGYKKKGLPIDTHCHRIPNRLGWIKTKTPEQTEKELRKILPKKYWFDFNDLFVKFGQNICKPIRPKCNICPIYKYCEYYNR